EPSGIKFNVPVEITFRFTEDEALICPPDLMSFATQDATGKWSFIDFDEYDSAGRTLKGSIEHFSYVSKSADLQLFPHTEDVRVKGIGQFWLYNVRTKKHHFVPDNTTFTWYVNGLNLPSEVYGKISSTDLCC